jgi:predicted transcriptional regulator
VPLTRISITVPRDLVAAADRRARELDRSRSWVLAEALRAWLGARGQGAGAREQVATARVREPEGHYAPGLGEYRLAQLKADLALTPEQRVREAERTAREAELVAGRRPVNQVLTFDRYEDYLEWKRHRDIGR